MIHLAYSCRNAVCGSTVVARLAGIQHANNVTAARNKGTVVKVIRSWEVIPYKTPDATFEAPNANGSPMPSAIPESSMPCQTMSRSTPPRVAPIASRIPISRVRLLTE